MFEAKLIEIDNGWVVAFESDMDELRMYFKDEEEALSYLKEQIKLNDPEPKKPEKKK